MQRREYHSWRALCRRADRGVRLQHDCALLRGLRQRHPVLDLDLGRCGQHFLMVDVRLVCELLVDFGGAGQLLSWAAPPPNAAPRATKAPTWWAQLSLRWDLAGGPPQELARR